MHRIFGKPLSADELVKKWRQDIRAQDRLLEKQLRGIDTEEMKVKRSLKEAAKRGDKTVCRMLAKEIVHSKRAKDRIHTSKAQLNSIGMQLQQQLSQVKVAGSLKKSSEIMKMVNSLVKLPEISHTMQEMSKEMTKAGIMEEMMNDTLDQVLDEENDEEEAEEEVQKVLTELAAGLFGEVGPVGSKLPAKEEEAEEQHVSQEEMDEMKTRLDMLRS